MCEAKGSDFTGVILSASEERSHVVRLGKALRLRSIRQQSAMNFYRL